MGVMEPDEPMRRPAQLRNLEPMGIAELEAYIAELQAEIARARAVIAAKQALRGGAEGLFKI